VPFVSTLPLSWVVGPVSVVALGSIPIAVHWVCCSSFPFGCGWLGTSVLCPTCPYYKCLCSSLFNSILIYFCANSTAQGPITKLARVDEIYKHIQSTKQGKIIITIRIIIIVIIVTIIIIILRVEGGSSRSHSLENSVWNRLLACRDTDKYLNNNNNILLLVHMLNSMAKSITETETIYALFPCYQVNNNNNNKGIKVII
jgi:hypothetical protein